MIGNCYFSFIGVMSVKDLSSFSFLISGNDKFLPSTFGMCFLLHNCLKPLLFCCCPLLNYIIKILKISLLLSTTIKYILWKHLTPYETIIVSSWLVSSRFPGSKPKTKPVFSMINFESIITDTKNTFKNVNWHFDYFPIKKTLACFMVGFIVHRIENTLPIFVFF